jgi:hypothetical protein
VVKSPEVMSKRKLSVLVVPASDSEPELEVRGVWKSLVAFFGRDGGGVHSFQGRCGDSDPCQMPSQPVRPHPRRPPPPFCIARP